MITNNLNTIKKATLVSVAMMPIWVALLFREFIFERGIKKLLFDDLDSGLILWIFERNYKSLTEESLFDFWNANQFYPTLKSLAFSDSIISGQLTYAPLRIIGFSEIESLFLTFAIIIITSSFLTVFFGNKFLKLNLIQWMIFCFVCQFSLTMTNYMNHYQFISYQLVPPFFLMTYDYILKPTNIKKIAITLLFIYIASFATYFIAMLLPIYLTIFVTIFFKEKDKFYRIINNIFVDYKTTLVALLLLYIFLHFQIYPYIELFKDLPKQNLMETKLYSAGFFSLFDSPSVYSRAYKSEPINGYWEYSYFPGFIILFGVLIGFAFTMKDGIGSERFLPVFMIMIFVVSYVLSLGPFLKIEVGPVRQNIILPFYLIAKAIPGFDNIRAPGRFGMFFTLPFAFFMVKSTIYFTTIKRGNFILVAVLSLLIYDASIRIKSYSFEVNNQKLYLELREMIGRREPTLILPLHGNSHIETIKNYISQLHISNFTGAWVLAGYGSKSTPMLSKYTELSKNLYENQISIKGLFCNAKADGIVNIVIEKAKFNKNETADLEENICGFNLKYKKEDSFYYSIKR